YHYNKYDGYENGEFELHEKLIEWVENNRKEFPEELVEKLLEILKNYKKYFDLEDERFIEEVCEYCNGDGIGRDEEECSECNGEGIVEIENPDYGDLTEHCKNLWDELDTQYYEIDEQVLGAVEKIIQKNW
ncbi:MAG: hypothetical protein ACOCRX_06245, partial [Candidatus Woesearchaeota archaeon]